MKILETCALVALLAAAAARADEPKEAVTAPAAAPAAEAPAKTAEQVAAEQKAAKEKDDKDAQARTAYAIKQARAAGYKPQTRKDGTVMYCRNEAPLGSRFEQQRCSTLEAMLDSQQKSQEMGKQLYDQGVKNIKLYGP